MWNPKCYTLINKMYDPIKDMRQSRKKLNILNEKMEVNLSKDQSDEFMNIVAMYIDNGYAPLPETPYYEDVSERLALLRHLKNLYDEYPRHHKRLMSQESREFRECIRMMEEDEPSKN